MRPIKYTLNCWAITSFTGQQKYFLVLSSDSKQQLLVLSLMRVFEWHGETVLQIKKILPKCTLFYEVRRFCQRNTFTTASPSLPVPGWCAVKRSQTWHASRPLFLWAHDSGACDGMDCRAKTENTFTKWIKEQARYSHCNNLWIYLTLTPFRAPFTDAHN